MEGLEDRLGRWLRRMSTAPTTSESMATNKASVACTETTFLKLSDGRSHAKMKHSTQQRWTCIFCLEQLCVLCLLPGSHVPGEAAGCLDSHSRWWWWRHLGPARLRSWCWARRVGSPRAVSSPCSSHLGKHVEDKTVSTLGNSCKVRSVKATSLRMAPNRSTQLRTRGKHSQRAGSDPAVLLPQACITITSPSKDNFLLPSHV